LYDTVSYKLNASNHKPNKAQLPSLNPKQSEISPLMEKSFMLYVKCQSQRSEESFYSLKR